MLKLAMVLAALAAPLSVLAAPTQDARVRLEIERSLKPAGGVAALSAVRFCDGAKLSIDGDKALPMAGLYQLPLAAAVFGEVDQGRLHLSDMISIAPEDIVPSSGILNGLRHPGVSLSLENLLENAVNGSDNTVGDVLLRAAGGPAAVNAWLRTNGLSSVRVDRGSAEQMRQFFGLGPGPIGQVVKAADAEGRIGPRATLPSAVYEADPRDTAQPVAMNLLLQKLQTGRLLSPAGTTELLDMLSRATKGEHRIPAGVPAGAVRFHKTGTAGGVTDDVAFLSLPDGQPLALSIFLKGSSAPSAVREKAFADAASAVWGYYTLVAAPCF